MKARKGAHGPGGDAGIRAHEGYSADVVIVDIFMPGQGGLQTHRFLRKPLEAATVLTLLATLLGMPEERA